MVVGKFQIIDSIHDLNVRKWQSFNKYYMIYHEVGGDFAKYDQHHAKLTSLIKNDMKQEAFIELANMRQGVYNAMQDGNNDTPYLAEVEAFRQLVIGSDEGIEDLSIREIREAIELVKKK